MSRSRIFIPFLLVGSLLAGCGREAPVAPTLDAGSRPVLDRTEYDRLTANKPIDAESPGTAGRPRVVFVPAGSVDALAAALAEAGPGGRVVLRRGLHTENSPIEITQPVLLQGESGAELKIASGAQSADLNTVVRPALVVRADDVMIRGLSIVPLEGDGNTAVLLRAHRVAVVLNRMSGFQYGVMVEQANDAKIFANDITVSPTWQTGAVFDAHGVVVINGTGARLFGNAVRGALFGIWACDRDGQLWANRCSDSFVGIILCKVPAEGYRVDGALTGAARSAEGWLTLLNETTNNLTTGLLVIDGANHNWIESNRSTGNGTYDVELTGDSMRFGFLTPRSFENTFVAGIFPNTEVKNCGENNTIRGGQLVDNTLEPCD